MQGEERRNKIIEELRMRHAPLSASRLAEQLGVSRQIIVGDVALLRAAGENIFATPRGYVIEESDPGISYTIACIHDEAHMEDELNILVDNGCCVENVIVEHPVYGQMCGQLNLSSRHDVQSFMKSVREKNAPPLSELTGGLHLHTIRCRNVEAYDRVLAQLSEKGYLLPKND